MGEMARAVSRKQPSKAAQDYVRDLLALARKASPEQGRRYVELARRAAMKVRLRLSAAQRAQFCPKCLLPWHPGRTQRTRTVKGRLAATCLACGHIARRRIR